MIKKPNLFSLVSVLQHLAQVLVFCIML